MSELRKKIIETVLSLQEKKVSGEEVNSLMKNSFTSEDDVEKIAQDLYDKSIKLTKKGVRPYFGRVVSQLKALTGLDYSKCYDILHKIDEENYYTLTDPLYSSYHTHSDLKGTKWEVGLPYRPDQDEEDEKAYQHDMEQWDGEDDRSKPYWPDYETIHPGYGVTFSHEGIKYPLEITNMDLLKDGLKRGEISQKTFNEIKRLAGIK